MQEILKVDKIVGKYQAANGEITAIDDLSFTVQQGELILMGTSLLAFGFCLFSAWFCAFCFFSFFAILRTSFPPPYCGTGFCLREISSRRC